MLEAGLDVDDAAVLWQAQPWCFWVEPLDAGPCMLDAAAVLRGRRGAQ